MPRSSSPLPQQDRSPLPHLARAAFTGARARKYAGPLLASLILSFFAVFGPVASSDGNSRIGTVQIPTPTPFSGSLESAAAALSLEPFATPVDPALPSANASEDAARAINARIPFAPQAAIPAHAFMWAGGSVGRERATDCLAAAGYYEAGLGAEDQRAVMQVILNRVRHQAFPHSVCGVVFQGSERSTGCQFSFTCDGSMFRRVPSEAAWRQAKIVALEMLTGRVEAIVGNATHYHTNWVHPYWSSEMQKIAAVKTHLFFRWAGASGDPQSFTNRYSGAEPQITRMALLSFAHQTNPTSSKIFDAAASPTIASAGDTTDRALIPPPIAELNPAVGTEVALTVKPRALPDQASAPDADIFLVALDGATDPDAFLRRAEQSCAGKTSCRFLGWTDGSRKASRFPVSGASIDAMSFSYIRPGAGEPAKARWNCAEFPREDRAQCLRRGG